MNKTLRIAAIVFGINMFFVILLLANQRSEGNFISIGLFWIFSMIIQFILGLIFVFISRLNQTGKGLLLGALVGLLVGFSVCSTMIR